MRACVQVAVLSERRPSAQCLQALVNAGAQLHATTDWGAAPLHLAIKQHQEDAVQCLLARGADACQADSYGLTPLHLAACVGLPSVATSLLAAGANINAIAVSACKQSASTPLAVALAMERVDVVDVLLKAGASLRGLDSLVDTLDTVMLQQVQVFVRQMSMAGVGSLMQFANSAQQGQDISLGKDLHHKILSCALGVAESLLRLLLNTEVGELLEA
jgi:ankyrin repeat protein